MCRGTRSGGFGLISSQLKEFKSFACLGWGEVVNQRATNKPSVWTSSRRVLSPIGRRRYINVLNTCSAEEHLSRISLEYFIRNIILFLPASSRSSTDRRQLGNRANCAELLQGRGVFLRLCVSWLEARRVGERWGARRNRDETKQKKNIERFSRSMKIK